MPIYEFKCTRCNTPTERVLKFVEMDAVQHCDVVRITPNLRVDVYRGVGLDLQPAGAITDLTAEVPCGGKLERAEISLNAKMSHHWQP